MTPLSATLSNLIVLAEDVITRPRLDRFVVSERLIDLACEVRSADARPAEDTRCTHAAMVMVICLTEIRDRSDADGVQWRMLAGAVLPLLRDDAFIALQQERGQR